MIRLCILASRRTGYAAYQKTKQSSVGFAGALGGKWDSCGLHWALPESQAEGGWALRRANGSGGSLPDDAGKGQPEAFTVSHHGAFHPKSTPGIYASSRTDGAYRAVGGGNGGNCSAAGIWGG